MAKVRQEADRYGLVGINGEWVLPATYASLQLDDVARHYTHMDSNSGIQYVLQRIIAGNRLGLVYDEDPSEAVGFSKVLLEPVYENLQIVEAADGTYQVIVDGSSGRLRNGRWIDPLKPENERKRLENEAQAQETERQRRWNEGAPVRARAERERHQAIQSQRKASGRCVMCGYPLGLIARLLRRTQHAACVGFDPADPRPPRQRRGLVS